MIQFLPNVGNLIQDSSFVGNPKDYILRDKSEHNRFAVGSPRKPTLYEQGEPEVDQAFPKPQPRLGIGHSLTGFLPTHLFVYRGKHNRNRFMYDPDTGSSQ